MINDTFIKNINIFLATPITPILNKENKLNLNSKKRLCAIIASFRNELDCNVFCAIEREKWGDALMSGLECTLPDYVAMKDADIVVAFPDQSFGVHLELGWGSALGKPMILLLNGQTGYKSPLVEGLKVLTTCQVIMFQSDSTFPSIDDWHTSLASEVLSAITNVAMPAAV